MADPIERAVIAEVLSMAAPHVADSNHLEEGTVWSFVTVAICSLTLFLNNGFMLNGKSVFDPLMIERLGVPIGALKASDTIAYITVALAAPLAGYLMDQLGPRPLFASGLAMMSAGLALYSVATSLWVVYLIHVMFGLCLVLSGSFACVIVVSEATAKRRGLAIGILLASASLGSGIAPTAYSFLGHMWGWQGALQVVAAASLCAIPAVMFLLPLRLDRIARPTLSREHQPTLGSALRSTNFWFLSFVAAIGYLVAIGLTSNMVLFLNKDMKLGSDRIDLLLMLMFFGGFAAQLVAGALSDVINRRVIHTISILVMAIGCLIFRMESEHLVWVAMLCFAIGWGGNYVLLQNLMPHLFAGPSIGRIVGVVVLVEALGGSAGPAIVGASYDFSSSYRSAFTIGTVALLITALVATQIKKNPS